VLARGLLQPLADLLHLRRLDELVVAGGVLLAGGLVLALPRRNRLTLGGLGGEGAGEAAQDVRRHLQDELVVGAAARRRGRDSAGGTAGGSGVGVAGVAGGRAGRLLRPLVGRRFLPAECPVHHLLGGLLGDLLLDPVLEAAQL